MPEMSKVTEPTTSNAESGQAEAPPSYSPRATSPQPVTPLNHPPSGSVPSDVETTTDPIQIHTPRPPFLNDPSQLRADPANVVCPRCHYGVQTTTRSRAGTHAGYILLDYKERETDL